MYKQEGKCNCFHAGSDRLPITIGVPTETYSVPFLDSHQSALFHVFL